MILNTYYIKLFQTGADRHNGILMSRLLQIAQTINQRKLFISDNALWDSNKRIKFQN